MIRHFRSAEEALSAPQSELLGIEGITPEKLRALARTVGTDMAGKSMERAGRSGVRVLTPATRGYPACLKMMEDPPLGIYVRGDIEGLNQPVAVVGTRGASPGGIQNARWFSEYMAGRGVWIVSGLARGIDTVAHEAALASEGKTVAVLGSGLGWIYPRENRRLAERIASSGALVTEFDYDVKPAADHFPVRNRLISALSLAVVVVEAPAKSGALITAHHALEQGRDVFAVPGNVALRQSEGSNRLIRDGAFCATHPSDVLFGIGMDESAAEEKRQARREGLRLEREPVWSCLGPDQPMGLDELSEGTQLPANELLRRLTHLESEGDVTALPGQRWFRNERRRAGRQSRGVQ